MVLTNKMSRINNQCIRKTLFFMPSARNVRSLLYKNICFLNRSTIFIYRITSQNGLEACFARLLNDANLFYGFRSYCSNNIFPLF
jgi:hypothetical protein